jgi:hypothetical protein
MLAIIANYSGGYQSPSTRPTAHFPLHIRRYFLYSAAGCSSSELLQQIRQSDQVFISKDGSSGGNLHERIDSSSIRAARQNRMDLAFGVVKVHAILTPIVAVFHQFELPPEQRMKRMGYAEVFLRTALMRCN